MSNELAKYHNEDTMIANTNDYDVYMASEYINSNDPIPSVYFPGSFGPLTFYQTRNSLSDIDTYKTFIDNCVHRFRKSRNYKAYKSYLMTLGLDRCQINGNIQDGMADIEMHHNFLTIYDITILISQHLLNTVGICSTFDVVSLLEQEHRNNNIPIVMLSKTAHQLYHDNPEAYIPISMTFGKWWDLLIKYRYGITLDISYKVIKYIQNCQKNNELTGMDFYLLSQNIQSWGEYNEYSNYNNYSFSLPNNGGNITFQLNAVTEKDRYDSGEEIGSGQIYTEAQIYGEGI